MGEMTQDEIHDVEQEGEDAFYAEKDQSTNPYDPSTDQHLSWNDGYERADLLESGEID